MTASADPTLDPSVDLRGPSRIAVVAADAADLEPLSRTLRGATALGHSAFLVWLRGEPGPSLRAFKGRVPLGGATRAPLRQRVRQVVTAPTSLRKGRDPLLRALRSDPRAMRLLTGADAVLVAGREAEAVADQLVGRGQRLVGEDELLAWSELGGTWRRLRRKVEQGPTSLDHTYARSLLDSITQLGGTVPAVNQPLLLPLLESLLISGELGLAARVAAHVGPVAGEGEADHGLRAAVSALGRTAGDDIDPARIRAVADEFVTAADAALAAEDTEGAVLGASLALHLLFHRELHADRGSSPLVEDPDAFLSTWRASRVGQLLATPVPRRPRHERAATRSHADGRPRVVVSPGSYPQFARPVIEALRERADVRVVDLASRPGLRGTAMRRELVDVRLRLALGEDLAPDYELLEELEGADALFVDWVDKAALVALSSLPEGVSVTLRAHSMDLLSSWMHLVDWDHVDDLVVVSEPMKDLAVSLVGDRLSGTRVHVIPNVIDRSRIPSGKTEGHLRRLLMVGWAQTVKDPVWALDVLGELRRDDPRWRLTLVGPDFPARGISGLDGYAAQFRRRLLDVDVRGGVDFVGQTRELAPHLAAAGFVLSTSRRESFGLGLAEGAASGAVPVVRNWPIFAPLDAARRIFPPEWVVGSVQEAAERIRAHAEEPAWGEASAATLAAVQERFDSEDARGQLARIILP